VYRYIKVPLKQIRADCEGLLFHFILLLFFSFPFLSLFYLLTCLMSFSLVLLYRTAPLLCYEGKKIRWNPVLSLYAVKLSSVLLLYCLHLTAMSPYKLSTRKERDFFAKWKELNSLSISSEKYSPPPAPGPIYLKHVLSQRTLTQCLRAICSAGAIIESPLYKMFVCPWKL